MMSLFLQAVCILELTCTLWVVATTSDGACPNRSFFGLNKGLDKNSGHRAVDLYEKHQYIFFLMDHIHKNHQELFGTFWFWQVYSIDVK